jgi:hypothetical protein
MHPAAASGYADELGARQVNQLRGASIPRQLLRGRSRPIDAIVETARRRARFLARRAPFWTRRSWQLELAVGE